MGKKSISEKLTNSSFYKVPKFPEYISVWSQPLVRLLLLELANYKVETEGSFPSIPSLILPYPHGEHLNSFLMPGIEKISYLAASDTFYDVWWKGLALSLCLNILPITRDNVTRDSLLAEINQAKQAMDEKKHHVIVYPQGTRAGLASSLDEIKVGLKRGTEFIARRLDAPVFALGIVYENGYNPHKGGTDALAEMIRSFKRLQRPVRRNVRLRFEELDPETVKSRHLFINTLAQTLWRLTTE